MNEILKGAKESRQLIDKDYLNPAGFIEPFVDFNVLLKFYYYNVYHQRSVKLKASLLSQTSESNLDKYLPKNKFVKDFLYAVILDLETYGNAFCEKAGTLRDFNLFHILGYQGRINKEEEIYQVSDTLESIKLDGYHLKYYSPSTKYYGEPDYLSVLEQIDTTKSADSYNSNFFKNGARPGFGIVFENSSPNTEQMQAFKEFFGSNYKGFSNAHKSLVLHTGKSSEGQAPAKVRLEKLNAIDDMSFEKLKSVTRDEIIAAHGVPPRLVGVMAAGQLGAGKELIDQLHSFNETVIKHKIQVIEGFFENIGIKHKIQVLDVTNFKDDSDLVTNLVDRSILSVQEAKEILGFR